MGYQEALSLNGRVEKAIAGAEMMMTLYGVEAKAAPVPAAKKPAEKKVSAVMEAMVPMKKEAEMPVEAPRAPPKPPKTEALAPVVGVAPEIEFEGKKGEEGALEFEAEEKRAKVEERWAGEARKRMEAPAAPAAKPTLRPSAAPEIAIRVPPILMGSPADSAAETIERIEKQFGSEVKAGKKVDKDEVKKRMLELTRELFREKSNERREEIKKEIVTLKTILSEAEGGKAKPNSDMTSVVRNDQEFELSSAKKAVSEAYVKALAPLLKYFDEEAALGRAAEALPVFESRASQLKEQVAGLAAGYEKYLVGKHAAEFERLAEKGKLAGTAETGVSAGHREAMRMADKVADTYSAEFFELRKSIASEIDAEVAKRRAEAGGNAGRGETEEDLLAYLQDEAPLVYGKYSRGEMARADAFAEARRLKARKGINKGVAED
jgi:hypothetical protein